MIHNGFSRGDERKKDALANEGRNNATVKLHVRSGQNESWGEKRGKKKTAEEEAV